MQKQAKILTEYKVPENIVWRPEKEREKILVAEVMKATGITNTKELTKHLYTEKYNQINSGK